MFNVLINTLANGLDGGAIAGIVIACILVLIIIIVLACSIRVIRQTDKGVVERLGGYHATWGTGIHFLLPFIDRMAYKVSMKEQVKDFAPQPVITRDNVTMQIDTIVFFQVTDPKLYAYGVENPVAALDVLDEATDSWGIKVNRVELKNILPPKDIRDAMERQMRAEREKREKILLSEGEKRSAILIAEGNKESAILNAEAEKQAAIKRAEGQAESIRTVKAAEAEGIRMLREAEADGLRSLKAAEPDSAVLTLKSYEALAKVADGKATKLIVPSNVQNLISMAMSVKEAVSEDKKE